MIAITNSGPQTLRVIQKGLRRDGSIEDTGTYTFMCIIHYPSKSYSSSFLSSCHLRHLAGTFKIKITTILDKMFVENNINENLKCIKFRFDVNLVFGFFFLQIN